MTPPSRSVNTDNPNAADTDSSAITSIAAVMNPISTASGIGTGGSFFTVTLDPGEILAVVRAFPDKCSRMRGTSAATLAWLIAMLERGAVRLAQIRDLGRAVPAKAVERARRKEDGN